MNYNNKPCPYCGSHMHETDEIVVCPICATPQHKECWMENGKCANEERHSDGYIWTSEDNIESNSEFNIKNNGDTVLCHICGSENPFGSNHCGSCGAVLNQVNQSIRCVNCGFENAKPGNCARCGYPTNSMGSEHSFDFDPSEKIGTLTAAEVTLYVRNNAQKFIKKFKKIENSSPISTNWAAFFLGPLWYFYRKIYSVGAILLVALAGISLIVSSSTNAINEIILPYAEQIQNNTLSQEIAADIYIKMFEIIKAPLLISSGLSIAINFIFSLFANNFYFKKIKSDYETISLQIVDNKMRSIFIQKRGGVSILSALCCFFSFEVISSIMLSIADYITQNF